MLSVVPERRWLLVIRLENAEKTEETANALEALALQSLVRRRRDSSGSRGDLSCYPTR